MGKFVNLEEVSAEVLPANVLVLLSKYAQAMRKHTGLVIKISSLNVFKHVHDTQKLTYHPAVKKLHLELLYEVTKHIERETMHTNHDREIIARSKAANATSVELLVPHDSFFRGGTATATQGGYSKGTNI